MAKKPQYRIAKSLDTMRKQINAMYPERSKVSDGWIGDTAHSSRKSDHNPNSSGVVCALDITHDPLRGPDTWELAETLRLNRDPRLKYVISNGRITSAEEQPWKWRKYTGSNKHAHHIHVSVKGTAKHYDDTSPWDLTPPGAVDVKPPAETTVPPIELPEPKPEDPLPDDRLHVDMAKKILEYDGTKATPEAIKAMIAKTDLARSWTTDPGVEFFLRDTIANRGPVAAAKILQMAAGVKVDGEVGPITRAAVDAMDPDVLLTNLRAAREAYEIKVYGKRPKVWKGLTNRWDAALEAAKGFSDGSE